MSSMNVPSQYNFILERAKSMPRPLRVAIAGSDTENILRGAIAAHEDGFVDPILIGNYKKTKKILSDLGYSDENFDFQPITNDTNPVQYAIEMILSGNADCLMRGNTQTRDLLLPVLNKTNHLIEEDRLLTHAVIFTVPAVAGKEGRGHPQSGRRAWGIRSQETQDRASGHGGEAVLPHQEFRGSPDDRHAPQ